MSIKAPARAHPQPIGTFAVMRHHENVNSMRLAMLHPTRKSAEEEAQRLFVEKLADSGGTHQAAFYVVEIVGRVGMFDGRIEG